MNLKCVNRWAMALAAVLALAACGGDEPAPTSSPTTIGAGTSITGAPVTQSTQTTPTEPLTTPSTAPSTAPTVPRAPSSAAAVAQRFWDATFAEDRALALGVGAQQVYDQLKSYVTAEESVVDPATFDFLGCDQAEPGTYSCEYRSSKDSMVDQILLSAVDDGRGSYYVSAMTRVCTHEVYGPCP